MSLLLSSQKKKNVSLLTLFTNKFYSNTGVSIDLLFDITYSLTEKIARNNAFQF